MKIGFYSSRPLEDKRNWSGTMFKIYEQLIKKGYEITWIPLIEYTEKEIKIFNKIEKTYNKIFNRGYNKHLFIYKAKIAAKRLKEKISQLDIDILFVPTKLNDIAYLSIKKPIIYLNDANAGQLLNYNPYYCGFGLLSKIETKYIEKLALKNADFLVFSSDWASNYAIEKYGINKEKVKTIKFGANIDEPSHIIYNKNFTTFTFLFLAVEWEKKGGQLAYECLKILRDKNYPVQMLVVGCSPPIEENWVKIVPFLNKNNPEELTEIQNYLQQSHFLFVPTRSEAYGIVFCEAAAYGLPIISTNTGGVSAPVKHGYNGFLLPENSGPKDYANQIEILLKEPSKIIQMSKNSSLLYEKELNWKKWGDEFEKIILKISSKMKE